LQAANKEKAVQALVSHQKRPKLFLILRSAGVIHQFFESNPTQTLFCPLHVLITGSYTGH